MNPNYLEDQWNEYRKRKRLFLYSIPLFFIGSAVAGLLANLFAIPEIFYATIILLQEFSGGAQ
jgi:hypothetical protein